jgi:hypothetical protein
MNLIRVLWFAEEMEGWRILCFVCKSIQVVLKAKAERGCLVLGSGWC